MSQSVIDDVGYTVFIPSVVFLVITPLVIITRIWSRLSMNAKLGADDWTIIVAAVSPMRPSWEAVRTDAELDVSGGTVLHADHW
jgi:hypothetical protein